MYFCQRLTCRGTKLLVRLQLPMQAITRDAAPSDGRPALVTSLRAPSLILEHACEIENPVQVT
jgi:hypothetical protein